MPSPGASPRGQTAAKHFATGGYATAFIITDMLALLPSLFLQHRLIRHAGPLAPQRHPPPAAQKEPVAAACQRAGGLPSAHRGVPVATFQSRQCFSAEGLDFFNREPAASKCMDRELEGGVGGIAFEASFEFLAPTSRASLTAQPLFAVTAEPVKGWSTWNPMGTGPETAKHPGSQPSKAARACRRRRVQTGQLRLAWPRRVASEALFSGQQSPAHSWAWRRLR